MKEDRFMKYYDFRRFLYLDTEASGVGPGTTLPQVRDNLSFGYDDMQCSDPSLLPARAYLVLNMVQQYIKRSTWDPAVVGEVLPLFLHALASDTQTFIAIGWSGELVTGQHQVWLLAQASLPSMWAVLAHCRWGAHILAMAQCFELG